MKSGLGITLLWLASMYHWVGTRAAETTALEGSWRDHDARYDHMAEVVGRLHHVPADELGSVAVTRAELLDALAQSRADITFFRDPSVAGSMAGLQGAIVRFLRDERTYADVEARNAEVNALFAEHITALHGHAWTLHAWQSALAWVGLVLGILLAWLLFKQRQGAPIVATDKAAAPIMSVHESRI